jgi:hypothetical protein
MERSVRPRKKACFSDSVERDLNIYALAATAAGVGMIVRAQPADARIVYTPTHVVIGKNRSFLIDLNHDGMPDFGVHNQQFLSSNRRINKIHADPREDGGGVMETDGGGYYFSFAALKRGARIGHGDAFVLPQYGKGILVAQCMSGRGTNSAPPCSAKHYNTLGDWFNVKNRYLGLMFPILGRTHYGWARLSVEVSRKPFTARAILTGYAYETIPNKSIMAGQTHETDDGDQLAPAPTTTPEPPPATLGLLAMGSPGLSIWRREESVAAALEGN